MWKPIWSSKEEESTDDHLPGSTVEDERQKKSSMGIAEEGGDKPSPRCAEG